MECAFDSGRTQEVGREENHGSKSQVGARGSANPGVQLMELIGWNRRQA